MQDSQAERFRTDEAHVESNATAVRSPTSRAEVLFGTSLLGHVDHLALGQMLGPAQTDEPGWLLPLTDLVLGRAALQFARPGETCVTVAMSFELGGSVPREGESIRGLSRHLSMERGAMSTSCEVRGDDGRLLAHAVGRFLMVRGNPPDALAHLEVGAMKKPLTETLRVGRDEGDDQRWTMVMNPWEEVSNPAGVIHGGVQAALMSAAAGHLVRRNRPQARLMTMTVEYFGPVRVAQPEIEVVAEIVRLGSNLATTESKILTPDRAVRTSARCTFDVRVETF